MKTNVKTNMKIRRMKNWNFSFPAEWLELNPEEASNKNMVAFLVEENKYAVYYSEKEARKFDSKEVEHIRKIATKFGFTNSANIYGYITSESIKNIGNARFIKKEEEKND